MPQSSPLGRLAGTLTAYMFELSGKFARKVCFRADLGRQQVLRYGEPDEVAGARSAHVRYLMEVPIGYIRYCQIEPDVPLANAEVMVWTFTTLHLEQ